MYGVSPQAYDRAITVFSPDGRLFQVEYAKEAVRRGATALAIAVEEGVVVAAVKTTFSPLVVDETIRKIHSIEEHIAITSSGLVADARRLVDLGREQARKHKDLYGNKAPVYYVAKYIADVMQVYTQYGGARPFGVSLLLAGIEEDKGAIYEIEPSGTLTGYKANSIGENKKETDLYLAKHYKENLGINKAIKLAVDALQHTHEKKLTAKQVEIAYITIKEKKFKYLDLKEKEKYLKSTKK